MIVSTVGVIGQVKLANVNKSSGLDVTKSLTSGDMLVMTTEVSPANNGPWTEVTRYTFYGGPVAAGREGIPIHVEAQIPDDPSYVFGRLNCIQIVGSWTLTPTIA